MYQAAYVVASNLLPVIILSGCLLYGTMLCIHVCKIAGAEIVRRKEMSWEIR